MFLMNICKAAKAQCFILPINMLNAAAEMFRYGMQKTTGLKLKKFQSNISHMKPIQKNFSS